MERRQFLSAVGGAVGGSALGSAAIARETADAQPAAGTMPRRVLGRTGVSVSTVGYSGLALVPQEQDACTRSLHRSFDRGLNYFDVAPAYGKGVAETKMGIGLQGLDRSKYFLACKTKARDAQGARDELETSLKLLKTDHFDLYQMHCLVSVDETKQALSPGGAIDTFHKAREEGKIRWIGFSAHSTRAALEALKLYNFDTVMFPINFVEWHILGFGKQVLELAAQRGTAAVAIKPMSRGGWAENETRTRKWWYRSMEGVRDIGLSLRFAWSLGVVTCFPPSFLDLIDDAITAAADDRPITEAEKEELRKIAESSRSIFRRWEEGVARHHGHGEAQLALGCPYSEEMEADC